jgi:hypothetical protein
MAKDRSTMLSLDVRHKSFVFYTALLGSVHAKLGDLVDRCNDNKGLVYFEKRRSLQIKLTELRG